MTNTTQTNRTPWNPPRDLLEAHGEAERAYAAAVQESNRAYIRAHNAAPDSREAAAFAAAYAITQDRFDAYRAARAAIVAWLATN